MKFEYILKILQKFNLKLMENKNFYRFNIKKLKNVYFFS